MDAAKDIHKEMPPIWVSRSGSDVDHPPPSSAEVEGRVQLYICSASGPSWPVKGEIYLYLLLSVEILVNKSDY
jgi:hypothetical protein